MSTGTSSIQYLEPSPDSSSLQLALDDSYFLVKIHDAQAYFDAGWLIRPGVLSVSTSVESSFQNPALPLQSLHRITSLQKNVPCHLGLSVNLTDWLPARASDWLRVTLSYTISQNMPLKSLIQNIQKIGLVTKVTTLSPELAIATKVSEVVTQLLSSIAGEESQTSPFSLKLDLNLSNLKAGYYVIIGSQSNEVWPSSLKIDADGHLTDGNNRPIPRISYVVFQILACKRRGTELARGKTWWEMLEMSKELTLSTNLTTRQERDKALDNWRRCLFLVRKYAYDDKGFLLKEIEDIIRMAHLEVQEYLLPPTKQESFGHDELPSEWQELLGVHTEQELINAVHNYKEAVYTSQQILDARGDKE